MPVQASEMKSTKHQQKTTGGTSTTTTNVSKKQKTNETKMNSIAMIQNTIELDEQSAPSDIYEKIYNMVGKGASTNLGQYTIEKADGLLSVVEKTARWSLPDNLDQKSSSNKTTDKKSDKLERPCGWLSFLSLIVALRFARIGLSFGSLMIGNDPITPESIVHFLQTRRRKLRAIKLQGLKSLRKKERAAEEKAKNSPKGVVEKLSSLMNLVICRPGNIINYGSVISCVTSYSSTITTSSSISSSESITTMLNDKKSKNFDASNKIVLNTNKQKPQPAQKRPLEEDDGSAKEDSNSDEELHCTQLLDKYGDKGSDFEDSDYVPDDKEVENESSETDDGIDEDISNENISNNEIISEEEKKNLSGKDQNDSLDTSSSIILATPKVNGPLCLNVKEEQQSNITPTTITTTTTEQNKNSSSLSPTSTELNSKSNEVNPVRLSPKIAQNGSSGDDEIYENFYDPVDVYDYDVNKGLRIRCRDLMKLSGGEECFYSPIGSPIVNDQPINNYQHYQLPSVVIDSVPSSSTLENPIPNEITNDNSVNDNRLSINATAEEILKGAINKNNVNNIKMQNNYQQKQQQHRIKNNYKNNKGKKLH